MNDYVNEYQKIVTFIKETCAQVISYSENNREKLAKTRTEPNEEQMITRIGFVSNNQQKNEAEHYFDLIVQENGDSLLRFGLGLEKPFSEGVNKFYNFTAKYSVDPNIAKTLVAKAEDFDMADLNQVLAQETTKITNITFSDDSSYDTKTDKASGKLYWLDVANTEQEFNKNGGITYDDNYDETLDTTQIEQKIAPILSEHLG
jgi:hypothetical protein